MEEIGLKQELLKSIGKINQFWPTGAETVENVRFGEHPAATTGRWSTKARSAASWFFRAFISIIGATCVISWEKWGGTG